VQRGGCTFFSREEWEIVMETGNGIEFLVRVRKDETASLYVNS